MRKVALSTLAAQLLVGETRGDLRRDIVGLAYDSRKVKPGYLFFCLPGRKSDGHQYIDDALRRGAAGVVVSRDISLPGAATVIVPDTRLALAVISAYFYAYPARKLRMIGVTGTNGKTTTAHLIDAVLADRRNLTGLLGTIRYRIGRESLPVSATTPESLDLNEMLAYMVEKGARYLTMEVSSHALALQRVAGCAYDIAVLTNLTEDHLDFHGTLEAYMAAKARLFALLGGDFCKNGRPLTAVLNRDDRHYAYFARCSGGQVVSYGINRQGDVRAVDIRLDNNGAQFEVRSFKGRAPFRLPLRGLFSVYNALAAITVGLVEGYALEEIRARLEKVRGIPGRFELVEEGQDFLVIVDFAHTPDGLENILRAARGFAEGRIICVFGCGGERDALKRPLMGEIAGRYSDYCLITSDNPRGEDPGAIIADILPGIERSMPGKDRYEVIPDRYRAIKRAVELARPRDVVIIAGKGHENYQIFADYAIPFSDRKVAAELIKEKLGRSTHENGNSR